MNEWDIWDMSTEFIELGHTVGYKNVQHAFFQQEHVEWILKPINIARKIKNKFVCNFLSFFKLKVNAYPK